MMNLGLKMMRNLGTGCAKFGRSERWYCVSRREKISFSTPPEVTFSTPPSLVSLLFTSFFGYLWYQTKAASEQERLWDVLSEKRNQIRILSRQDESKRKKVKEAEIKLIEKAATVLSEEIQV